GGVDVVVGAVLERDLHIDHRVSGEDAELHRVLATGVDRGDVLLRHATTGDVVGELVAALATDDRTVRLDRDDDLGELARATGLLLVRVGDVLDLALDRLAVRDLGLADVGLDLELAARAVDQ